MCAECSIIIPAFNAASTIGDLLQCLETGGQFTYEIIVVDDGSTDHTGKVLNQFINIASGIKVIKKLNGGVSSARNRGLQEAVGKWIYFADADDRIHFADLEQMISKGNELNVDIVVSDYLEENILKSEKSLVPSGISYNRCLDRNYIERTILHRFFIGETNGLSILGNKLYRNCMIKQNMLSFDENRTHGEDWKFNIQYFQCANSAVALDTVVYSYIMDGSQTYQKYKKKLSYSLLEGHRIAREINRKYEFADEGSDEYRSFMNRFLRQSLNYLKLDGVSNEEKRTFLLSKEEQDLYAYFLQLSSNQLGLIHFSRKDRIAFFLLKMGICNLALRILEVS